MTLWPVQRAIYDRLTAHAAMQGVTVIDTGDAKLPHVRIGITVSGSERSSQTTRGSDDVEQIDVHADRTDEVKQIAADIDEALTDPALPYLSADGVQLMDYPRRQNVTVRREEDPESGRINRHAVLEYLCRTPSQKDHTPLALS